MSHLRRTLVLPAFVAGVASMLVVPAAPAQAADSVDVFIGSLYDTPDPAYTSSAVSYVVSVGNRGPGTATAVTLTTQLPTGVSFRPFNSDSRCSSALDIVTCNLSTLPANVMASPLVIAVT